MSSNDLRRPLSKYTDYLRVEASDASFSLSISVFSEQLPTQLKKETKNVKKEK